MRGAAEYGGSTGGDGRSPIRDEGVIEEVKVLTEAVEVLRELMEVPMGTV